MDELLIYINGELVPESQASISVFDSGFNFGDGVFEGMRVYDGRVWALDEHIERLYNSAKAIMIDIPLSKEEMRAAMMDWLRANKIRDNFHFRPIVTRGIRRPPRTHPGYVQGPPTVVFLGGPISPSSGDGLRVVTATTRRIPADALDAKIKSGSFLNYILAKLEAIRQGVDDALMYDTQGYLAEGSASNIFLFRRGELITPFPRACLEGITRRTVMNIAGELGYPVRERDITPVEVYSADEIFLTGTAAEVAPVIEVDGRQIGDGRAGPVSRRIGERFREVVRLEGVPLYGGD